MADITIGNGNTAVNEGILTGATLTVGSGDDSITLAAGSTNDTITLGGGNDELQAHDLSNSTITAGNGSVTIVANGNGDTITAGSGANTITAGGNGDTITVGNGNNSISTGSDAAITIGNGIDVVIAGADATIAPAPHGDSGDDTITAGPDSTITLGNGNDTVFAGADSTITVGNGTDTIHAGSSNTITIGHGADEIVYDGLTPNVTVPASLSVYEEQSVALPITIMAPSFGQQVINGFRSNQDVIALDTADFADYATVQADSAQVGKNTVITLDPSDTITLKDVSLSRLSASNFKFFTGASDTISITGVPLDATLSAGTNNGGGSWSLTPGDLSGLTLNAGEPVGYSSPVNLTVSVANPAGQGAVLSQDIGLIVNPVKPTVGVSVLDPKSGDPVTETRLQVTANADDGDGGNDYINRLVFTNLPSGVTLSGTGLTYDPGTNTYSVATSGNPASLTYDVTVNAPANKSTDFNLGVTAYSDEPNSPEVSKATSQNIDIAYTTASQSQTFLSQNQNIWTSGTAFTKSFDNFIGIDYPSGYPGASPASGKKVLSALGVTQTFGGSLGLKAGFQSDLNITGGTFNGSLPFNVKLADTYNKTNNTLEILPTESQLGGGNFTTHGAGGSYELGLVLDAYAKAYTSGFLGSKSVTVGPHATTISLINKKSTTLSGTIGLPDGIGNVTFAWPQVNTAGSNPNPGTISASGTSPKVFAVNLDPIDIVSIALLDGENPFKGSFFGGHVGYTLLAGTVNPGIDMHQSFNLDPGGLSGTLNNGSSTVPISFGTPIVIDNPSNTSVSLNLKPDATLENTTSLGAAITLGLRALAGDVKLTVAGVGTTLGFGPLINPKTTINTPTFAKLYDKTFNVAFQPQTLNFNIG